MRLALVTPLEVRRVFLTIARRDVGPRHTPMHRTSAGGISQFVLKMTQR